MTGSNPAAEWELAEPSGSSTSYYIGRDTSKWASNVPEYRRLIRRRVYPGIDVAYYGAAGRMEYDFVVAPHADPSRIRIRMKGARRIYIRDDGTLVIDTSAGQIIQHKPELFQLAPDGSRRTVEGEFRLLSRNEAGFAVGRYDHTTPLSIDPVLDSSSYMGGNSDDKIVCADGRGNVVATTTSIDFPGATLARRKGADIVVQTSTQKYVFGGSGDDQVTACDFGSTYYSYDSAIVIGGYTNSQDLPTSFIDPSTRQPNTPWQAHYAGGTTDGFILTIDFYVNRNPSGLPVIFLSYFGTPGDDRITAVSNRIVFRSIFAFTGTTNAPGLPAAQSSLETSFQAAPAGGLDGFLVAGVQSSGSPPYILASTYFGGSGDDIPSTVLCYDSVNYYVAGETKSADFPLVSPISSQRAGDSDAFLANITLTSGVLKLTASTLLGAGGNDRGVQLASNPNGNGNILLAGTTSSSDFPISNAMQTTYGGGVSDAFLAQFVPDLSKLVASTYFGGSGEDEATSITTDVAGNIFLAGRTSSTDLPVKNAIQASYAGGPDDGFLVHLEPDGSINQATYFGGSKSDRILGLYAPGGPSIWLNGQTTSPDLLLRNAAQSSLSGISDGFIAHISTNVLQIGQTIGGKDIRAIVPVWGGNLDEAGAVQLTVTSSDPSKIVVAEYGGGAGRSSVTVPLNGNYGSYNGVFQYIAMDCLDDNGGTGLTFSAPGYADKTVHASCFETHIRPSLSSGTMLLSSLPPTLSWYLFASDPNSPAVSYPAYSLRPGADPITVEINNTNPAVGTLSQNSFVISADPNPPYMPINFTPISAGQTELVFTSPALKPGPYDRLPVSVGSPVAFSGLEPVIPAGFQLRMFTVNGPNIDSGTPITFTSQDPTKLLLSTDQTQLGSASTKFPAPYGQVYAQALASSGDVPVTISVPGSPDVTTTVHLREPVAKLTASKNPLYLNAGDSALVNGSIGAAGNPPYFGLYYPNPGSAPLTFTLNSSNPSLIAIKSNMANMDGRSGSVSFELQALDEGSANLTLTPPEGIGNAGPPSLPVIVRRKFLQLDDIEVGKDLTAPTTLVLPQRAPSALTVQLTINSPDLALLSTDGRSPGQPQLSLSLASGATTLQFYVYGLASSGQTKVTAQVPGVGSVTATVQLDPSGAGWTQDQYTGVLHSTNNPPAISTFALDPGTLLPIGAQVPRPGVVATANFTTSNSGIISVVPNVTLSPVNLITPVGVNILGSGKATLRIIQPPGFTTPSIRQELAVNISIPSLSLYPATLARDTQESYSISPQPSVDLPLTLMSSDPSKLVISTDPRVPGSASVTIPPGADHSSIYLQALDSQGSVTVTASEPTYKDAIALVTLTTLTVRMFVDTSASSSGTINVTDNVFSTTIRSPKTHISLQLYVVDPVSGRSTNNNLVSFRPGVAPPVVDVISSDVSIGQITGSPVRLVTGGNSQAGVDFQPLAIGQTEVRIVQPTGFGGSSEKAILNVTAPGFKSPNALMGKDTAVMPGIALPENVLTPTLNATVTITSTDPTRLLLSRDAESTPAASITSTLIAGQRSVGGVMIHALGNNGTVPVKISAPGYAESSFNVALTDLVFSFGQPYESTPGDFRALLQAGPQQMTVSTWVIFPKGLPRDYVTYGYGGTVRPGANIPVNVVSSDPGIVAIDKSEIVFTGGSSSMNFTYRPIAIGQATLSLNVPDGYRAHPSQSKAFVTVDAAKLSLSNYGGSAIGRDLQLAFSISPEVPFSKPTEITVSSSDPSRLLISAKPDAPGEPTIKFTPIPSQSTIYLQSLSDNGSVTVTASADGYRSGTLTVGLAPAAAVFRSYPATQNIYTNSGPQRLALSLVAVDPSNLRPGQEQLPRAGVTPSVAVSSSDPKVISVNTPAVQFTLDTPYPVVELQPRGIGTAIVSLELSPRGIGAASGQQLVFNVTEPDLFIPDFALGQDLQVAVTATLASRLPIPSSNVPVSICSDGGGLNLSLSASDPINNSCVSVNIPAGQRVSTPFFVRTFLSTGSGQLRVSGPNYAPSSSGVSFTQTAFIFREANQPQPVNVTRGGTATLTVVPALFPLTADPIGPLSIRGGVTIPVTIISTEPKVAVPPVFPVVLKSGDQQATVTVQALAPGTATLSLAGTIYQFLTPKSSLTVQVK